MNATTLTNPPPSYPVLVAGGTGNVGSLMVKLVKHRGCEVVTFANQSTRHYGEGVVKLTERAMLKPMAMHAAKHPPNSPLVNTFGEPAHPFVFKAHPEQANNHHNPSKWIRSLKQPGICCSPFNSAGLS